MKRAQGRTLGTLLASLVLTACGPQSVMLMDSSGMAARNIGNPIKTTIYWTNVAAAEQAFLTAVERSLDECVPVPDRDQESLILSTVNSKFIVGIRPTRNCAAYAVFTNMTIRDAGLLATTIDLTDLRTPAIKMLYPDQLRNALTALRSRQDSRPGVIFLALLSILGIE